MLLWKTSYDHYSTSHLTRERFTTLVNSDNQRDGAAIVPLAGRCGSSALRVKHPGTTAVWESAGPHRSLAPGSADGVIGSAVKVTQFPANFDIFRIYDGGSTDAQTQLRLQVLTNGKLRITRGPENPSNNALHLDPASAASNLGTSALALSANAYYFIELVFEIGNSADVSAWVNGVEWLPLTGVDTDQANSGAWDGFQLGRLPILSSGVIATTWLDFDDSYVIDTTGGLNDARLGDMRIEAIANSTGNGSNTGWTPSTGSDHGALVDDSTPDDDSTTISAQTAGLRDTFNYPAISASAGSIISVQVLPCARKDDSGLKELSTVVRTGGVNYDGTAQSVSTESYLYYPQIYEENPGTTNPWSVAEVNAAEFGVKVVT